MMRTMTATASTRLAWGAIWERAARYFDEVRHRRPSKQLRVKEALSLGEKRQLFIVECGSRQLLIGTAGNFLATLAELEPADPAKDDDRE